MWTVQGVLTTNSANFNLEIVPSLQGYGAWQYLISLMMQILQDVKKCLFCLEESRIFSLRTRNIGKGLEG